MNKIERVERAYVVKLEELVKAERAILSRHEKLLAKYGPQVNTWDRDDIQFARLLAELETVGAFATPEGEQALVDVSYEMDVDIEDVWSLLERAQAKWDKIKADTPDNLKARY